MAAAECMLVRGKQSDHMTRHCNRSYDSGLIERSARLLAYQTYDWCLIWLSVRDEDTTNPIIWGGLGDVPTSASYEYTARAAKVLSGAQTDDAPPLHVLTLRAACCSARVL